MLTNKFQIISRVWIYPGMAGWHFVSVPKGQAIKIKQSFGGMAAGFGSLPVVVTIGKVSWKTSIFPDKKTGTYLLPLKAEVRKKENIKAGQQITFSIQIRI